MSRYSDAVQVIKSTLGILSNSCRLSKDEVFHNSYIRKEPAVYQASVILLDNLNKNVKNDSKLDLKRISGNLPLVLEGIQLYVQILLGSLDSKKADNLRADYIRTEGRHSVPKYRVDINKNLRSVDLLELDVTDQKLLRSKLFKKTLLKQENAGVPVETPPVQDSTTVSAVSGQPAQQPFNKLANTQLSPRAQERRVPSSRLSRLASFTSLGAGLGLGVAAEASRRLVGIKEEGSGARLDDSLILNKHNAERIVSTLCRVRGAALKLGQLLSIQDTTVISPQLQAIFDRVRESADFMPSWQLHGVMSAELGPDWRDKFKSFNEVPFAAASIGQVHSAELHDGAEVAVKVQYPGVAKSIDSDIRNLMGLLSVLAILPEGLFIDNITKHMKIELAQECDYVREGECGVKMRRELEAYPEYYVPTVYQDHSTYQVLTTEMIHGLTIDRCGNLSQNERTFIAESILKLVFRELFLHRYMQTDPNWANFLYNPDSGQIGLLDFGATREYRPEFVNTYFKIIDGAAGNDRQQVLDYSRQIGFLTGYESKIMNDAHVDSVMLLARPFQENKIFNFANQKITHEIQELMGIMLKHRLCPPPPEIYSLHRKLSGLFLLASKLKTEFNCYEIWQDIRTNFRKFEEGPAST